MAAGQGFKTFTTGEVLTAGDVNGYLMQGVLVFASTAARDAAITSPQEGQFAYLKDTNVTTYYTGSAWANVDSTGMTNPMTTTGDTIYSSSGSTPARLGIGSTGNVLTVAGGVPTWSAPASGGKVLQVVSSTYSTSVTNTTSTYADTNLTATITPSAVSSRILVLLSQQIDIFNSSSSGVISAYINILRGSTQVPTNIDATQALLLFGATVSGMQAQQWFTYNFVDSPASTSALTYKTQSKVGNGTRVITSPNGTPATLTLIEIGA
jgi:hypothetical protein